MCFYNLVLGLIPTSMHVCLHSCSGESQVASLLVPLRWYGHQVEAYYCAGHQANDLGLILWPYYSVVVFRPPPVSWLWSSFLLMNCHNICACKIICLLSGVCVVVFHVLAICKLCIFLPVNSGYLGTQHLDATFIILLDADSFEVLWNVSPHAVDTCTAQKLLFFVMLHLHNSRFSSRSGGA
jgi:hypothetical protein